MDVELFDAIYTLFIASAVDSDVVQTGELTHGIYSGIGPDEARMPYVTVNVISSVPVSTFDDDNLNDTIIQFSIFSKSNSTVEIGAIAKNLKAAFDRVTLVYDTRAASGCLRIGENTIRLDDCWMWTIDYRIHFH